MNGYRGVLASIVLGVALCAVPAVKCESQDQERLPPRDATGSKVIRTHRLRTPADFFKQESVRFERARIDMSGSILADGHNLSLYGAVLLRRDKICTSAEGARWACRHGLGLHIHEALILRAFPVEGFRTRRPALVRGLWIAFSGANSRRRQGSTAVGGLAA